MRKSTNLLLLMALSLCPPLAVRADMPSISRSRAECDLGEREVRCRSEKMPDGTSRDGCEKYAENSDYYYLTTVPWQPSSGIHEYAYCLKAGAADNLSDYQRPMVAAAVTIAAGVSYAALVRLRRKRQKEKVK